MYTLNVGDSRAVLVKAPPQNRTRPHTALLRPVQLTIDHTIAHPPERARVLKAGAFIVDGRINGRMDVTRTIGDCEFKAFRNHPRFNEGRQYVADVVTCEPDITAQPIGDSDIGIVLATDGLWVKGVTNDAVVLAVEAAMEMGKSAEGVVKGLVDMALERGGEDNVTAIYIPIRGMPERVETTWIERRREQRAQSKQSKQSGQRVSLRSRITERKSSLLRRGEGGMFTRRNVSNLTSEPEGKEGRIE